MSIVPKRSDRVVSCQLSADSCKLNGGFTTIELLMVILFFIIAIGVATVPLATVQSDTALKNGRLALKDTLRRAVTQSLSGYLNAGWGLHLSDGTGCALPATQYHIYRGQTFDAASDTTDVIELPQGAEISGLDIGGGCDIRFSRFHGTATSTGTVTLRNVNGATTTLTVNEFGRISE